MGGRMSFAAGDPDLANQLIEASLDLLRLAEQMHAQERCAEAETLWVSVIERCVTLMSRAQAVPFIMFTPTSD